MESQSKKLSWEAKFQSLLIEIGLILGPSTFVALVGEIVDAPRSQTAIVALVLAALCFIILKYNFLRRKFPSPYALIILVVVSTYFYVKNDHLINKETGLIDYSKHGSKIHGQTYDALLNCKENAWYFGTNFHITVDNNNSLILKKLRAGIDFKFLIFNPQNPLLEVIAKDFNQSDTTLYSECIKGLASLKRLKLAWEKESGGNLGGKLEIKLFSNIPRFRAYMFDYLNESKGISFVNVYANGVNSPELPYYVFSHKESGVMPDYLGSVENVWRNATPFEEFKFYNELK